jgi:hypothetical protein
MPHRCAREDVRFHRARADRGLPATGLAAAVFVQGGLQRLSSALVLSYQSSTAPPQGGLGVGRDRAGQRRVAGDPSINAHFEGFFLAILQQIARPEHGAINLVAFRSARKDGPS